MEHVGSPLFDTTQIAGDGRGILANAGGNISFTFVPLISLMATFVPRIVSRFKNIRPTQTVSSRGFRNAKFYAKKSLDIQFCNNLESFEAANLFPGFDDIFYICKPYEEKKMNCQYNKEYHFKEDDDLLEKQAIGKIIGMNDCFYLQLYKCNKGFYFDPEKKSCIHKNQQQQLFIQQPPTKYIT